jgi:DNA topoisomerase-1
VGKSLVIVESPAKARTIAGYLGSDYTVESSIGHVRDLPDRASDIPKEQRKRFGSLGVDVNHAFEPYYVVDPDKKKVVTELRKRLASADELLLATDEDREGEAIAWHLVEVLKPKVPVRRMVFHEITRDAIERALADTRAIDVRLVDAQETRRILDRLYGYEVSPVLWKKVTRGLSAGRVQSVATRLVVQRERERVAFVSSEYWDIAATLDPGSFDARLVTVDGHRVAQGRDFAADGTMRDEGLVRLDEEAARALAGRLEGVPFAVSSADEKPYRRRPSAPFMTSTLQQEASRKLRFSAQTTMRVAQRLYEAGHITYMRTDSTTLAESALEASRAQARKLFGDEFVPAKPRRYERKVKNAQEAHEAIRPAGESFRTPDGLAGEVSRDELALYELIWRRTLASQMEDAVGRTVSLRIGATTSSEEVEFGASGTVITFRGFLAAYEEGRDEPSDDAEERRLPDVSPGDALEPQTLTPEGHSTTPPPRYTEATLVRALEERGIGRPSTYAAILSTIVDRGYVFKKGSALVPTFVAFAVVTLLEQHFRQLVDFDFTARMEDDLDEIAEGRQERVAWLERFYFGSNGNPGLHHLVTEQLDEIDARAVNSIAIPGTEAVVRVGRYGPYLELGDQRASLPADTAPDELTAARAEELLAQPDSRSLGVDPSTGREIIARTGRYGPYVTEVLPEGAEEKPRTASLFSSMSPETVALDDALRLLSLPRVLGTVDGEEVTAQNGRYGPYVKKGSESRSLESEEQLFSVTLDDAVALLAQPPRRRSRRGSSRTPLRELGPDPATERPIVLREGRFGPYVTDGESNASLRRGDTADGMTIERAAELLAEKRAKSG